MNATRAKMQWLVRCADYTIQCSTREGAERRKSEVEQAGHCSLSHEVEPMSDAPCQRIVGFPGPHGFFRCDLSEGHDVHDPTNGIGTHPYSPAPIADDD